MFGAVERQSLSTVVVHHLRDAGEHAAALVQGVAVLLGLRHNDMNAALARPESHRREEIQEMASFTSSFHILGHMSQRGML